VVPGTGNGDTVPAMLMPGEFVIRKKAVETIGADNLHSMNKYGGGGSIRAGGSNQRKRFATGGAVEIRSLESIKRVKDGDSFIATAIPRPKPFEVEFRVGGFDAYETMGARANSKKTGESKVTQAKLDQISQYEKNANILNKVKKAGKKSNDWVIPPETIVTNSGLTAVQAGDQATIELKKNLDNADEGKLKQLKKQIVQGDKDRYNRLLIKGDPNILTISDEFKTGRTFEYNSGGRVQKFMAGGTVDTPKLIQRGTLSYSLEDILKAGLTEEQFLEKIPVPPPLMAVNPKPGEYGTQFKIGGVGSGSVPMPKFLKPYLPPDSEAFQSSQDAAFKRSEAAVEYRKKKGLMPRDYEGKSSTEKSFLAAKDRGYNVGGMVQKFMAGGKTEPAPFGTGETKFPKRITNAYAKELQKKLDKETVDNAWYPYPSNERITVDPEEVSQKFQNEPFDRKRFLSLFNTKISRNELVGNLSDFAKFIGLPGEDLAKVLPQTIDFGGELQRSGNRGTFSKDSFGTQGYDNKGLEAFGFTAADEQDLFGYQKLMDEKNKEIQKIMKTPTRTFDDGSFSYDSDAFTKSMDEKMSLGKKISDVMSKRAVARKGLMEQKKGVLASTGRGFVSMASNSFEKNQPKNVLYHELTHQLLNSLRTQSEDSFTKYKERVSQLFNGDNDDLADAFDALGGSYNSADVVYGRSYKNGLLDNVLQDLRRKTMDAGGRSADPDMSKEAYSMWVESGQKKNAREYRPINPKINDLLLKGGQKQETLDKVEDYGKEEFLTTLVQNAPKLDSNMQGILDSTLNELLGNTGIQRQAYAEGGKVTRNLGYIDFDVINDPANAEVIEQAMKKAGVDGPRNYTEYLTNLAIKARKEKSLNSLKALYGVAGAGKSSIVAGRGSNDNGTLRQTNRFPILTPEDITKASEVMLLTSTVSQDKLEGMLQEVDRAYTLSSTTKEEKDRILKQRTMRDVSGVGLFGRVSGSTAGAPLDTAKEEALLEDRLGSKSVVLGRKDDGGLRRKTGNELVEATKKKLGLTWGGFAPTTIGHESMMEAAKAAGISYQDFIALVGSDEAVDAENYRTAVFDKDFRLVLAKAGFGSKGASVLPKAFGDMSVPLAFDMGEKDGRRQVTLAGEGSMAFVADKTEKQMEKYKKAGYGVSNLQRTGGISGTQVRDLLLDGNLEGLQQVVSPGVFSLLKGNMVQLQNRSNILPTLIEQAEASYKQEVSSIDQQLLATGITRADNKKAETDPEYASRLELYQSLKAKKKKLETKKSFEPYSLLRQLADKDPAKYGLRLDTDSLGAASTPVPSSAIQQAILAKVTKETSVKKSSGILPAQGSEILKRFGTERLPNDPSFGPFSGKTVRDTADGGKLKYWNSAFRPETKADKLAYYTATRDYLIQKFNESQGTKSAQALSDTTSAVLSSEQLGLVGLNPLGYTGLLGPETWNLGTDPSGKERSINASIVQRGLPNQYQNVIDYLSGRTEEIVGEASKLLGIAPSKLTKKQRETLGQGNIEGALLEQIFGSAGAMVLDDALRTRPIDFPMGIGPKAAKIFGIDPSIPTEVKRTIDSGSRGKAVEEFKRYFRQKYGIPDPEKAVQKLADGGSVEDKKKEKNFGKIGIKNSGSEIIATYLGKKDRSGMVSAKKMTDNLYTIGLSKATKGYGPKLYDIVMEAATANGGMLAPDRNIISGAAKDVWSYYFNKRSDVRKTPLDRNQWTQNSALIDPKLLGDKNTWPPYSDPAWILQSGYSKNSDILNGSDIVNLNDDKYKAFLQSQQLSFFAQGGSVEDTVPALLTPGEFVINKKAAQNIGYSKLNKLNQADKLQGYNSGGFVRRYAAGTGGGGVPGGGPGGGGGSPLDPAARAAADALSYFALQAEYYGKSVGEYQKSLKQQIIDRTLAMRQEMPKDITSFKLKANQLRGVLEAPDTGSASVPEEVSNARDELKALLSKVAGPSVDDDALSGAIQDLEARIESGLSFDEAIQATDSLTKIFKSATDTGEQYTRVLEEFSAATGVAEEELEKIASFDAVKTADRLNQVSEAGNKLFGRLTKLAGVATIFSGVLGRILEAEGSKTSRVLSAGIQGGVGAAAQGVAYGQATFSNLSSVAQSTSLPSSVTGAAGQAAAFMTSGVGLALGGVAVAAIGVAAALKDASNAAREFDIERANKSIDESLQRVANYFTDFAKDVKNTNILALIEQELVQGVGAAIGSVRLQTEVPKTFWANLIDSLANGDAGSSERSRVLEQQGVGAYSETTAFAQNPVGFILQGLTLGLGDAILQGVSGGNLGLGVGPNSAAQQAANQNMEYYTTQAAPQLAQQRAQTFQPVAENVLKLGEEQLRSGVSDLSDVLGQLGSSTAPSQFAQALARSNPLIEEQIIRIKASNDLTKTEKDDRINNIISIEAEYKARLRYGAVLKALDLEKLNKDLKNFTTSISRVLNNVSMATNKAAYDMDQLAAAANLTNKALSGVAEIGNVSLKSINVLQNSRMYGSEENAVANSQASSNAFGSLAGPLGSLIGLGDKLESTALRTINDTIDKRSGASAESISGAVRAALNTSLNDIGLPPELSEKLSKEVQRSFAELRTGEDKKLSFDELVEKIPQFAEAISTAKNVQEAAIKQLETWQNAINDYAKAMNQTMEYQLESNERFRKSTDIRIKSEEDLAKTLGKPITLLDQRQNTINKTASLTGGATNAADIGQNILRLNNVRATQQDMISGASNGGVANYAAIDKMTRNLNQTNLALRENYQALKDMADSSDEASSALSKINEAQQKNQAAQNIIEKLVTSNAVEINRFNKSLGMLNNNMAGGTNNSTPEERSQVLQTFNMIAPLLGDQQNPLKANVLESLLKEAGIGINGLFADVITSLRSPESDPNTAAALQYYREAIAKQIEANNVLAGLQTLMAANTAEAAGAALAKPLEAQFNFEINLLKEIRDGIVRLGNVAGAAPVAQARANGGIIYAEGGALVNFQPKGTDTVPAMLTPGEFVVNRQATQKNLPLLKNINSGDTSYYAFGGIVRGVGDKWAKPGGPLAADKMKSEIDADTNANDVTEQSFLKLKNPGATPSAPDKSVYASPLSFYAVADTPGPF
jgi:hypothetical protein